MFVLRCNLTNEILSETIYKTLAGAKAQGTKKGLINYKIVDISSDNKAFTEEPLSNSIVSKIKYGVTAENKAVTKEVQVGSLESVSIEPIDQIETSTNKITQQRRVKHDLTSTRSLGKHDQDIIFWLEKLYIEVYPVRDKYFIFDSNIESLLSDIEIEVPSLSNLKKLVNVSNNVTEDKDQTISNTGFLDKYGHTYTANHCDEFKYFNIKVESFNITNFLKLVNGIEVLRLPLRHLFALFGKPTQLEFNDTEQQYPLLCGYRWLAKVLDQSINADNPGWLKINRAKEIAASINIYGDIKPIHTSTSITSNANKSDLMLEIPSIKSRLIETTVSSKDNKNNWIKHTSILLPVLGGEWEPLSVKQVMSKGDLNDSILCYKTIRKVRNDQGDMSIPEKYRDLSKNFLLTGSKDKYIPIPRLKGNQFYCCLGIRDKFSVITEIGFIVSYKNKLYFIQYGNLSSETLDILSHFGIYIQGLHTSTVALDKPEHLYDELLITSNDIYKVSKDIEALILLLGINPDVTIDSIKMSIPLLGITNDPKLQLRIQRLTKLVDLKNLLTKYQNAVKNNNGWIRTTITVTTKQQSNHVIHSPIKHGESKINWSSVLGVKTLGEQEITGNKLPVTLI